MIFKNLFKKEKRLHDEFIARIRVATAGEGMISDGNIVAFDHAIRHLPPTGEVLEIGSFGGMSANIICWLLRKNGLGERRFFTCDPWMYEGFHDTTRAADDIYMSRVDGSTEFSRVEYCEFVRKSFLRSVGFFSRANLPHSFQLTSDAFFEKWSAGETLIDLFGKETRLGGGWAFCYVDGDHAYDFARRDVENCLAGLVAGGFLLLDDSADGSQYGSSRLARELLGDSRLRLVEKFPNYLFQRVGGS